MLNFASGWNQNLLKTQAEKLVELKAGLQLEKIPFISSSKLFSNFSSKEITRKEVNH